MKVLIVNGSPHKNGTTAAALAKCAEILAAEGIETETLSLAGLTVRDCTGCTSCYKTGKCAIDDVVNEFAEKCKSADGFLFGSPVYYAHPSGALLSFLDRLFYSASPALCHKPGAAVLVARRAGNAAAFDVINKYFTINEMPVVSSTYWNMVFGKSGEEAALDEEGMRTMENLARNMAWLLRSLEGSTPPANKKVATNFIR